MEAVKPMEILSEMKANDPDFNYTVQDNVAVNTGISYVKALALIVLLAAVSIYVGK